MDAHGDILQRMDGYASTASQTRIEVCTQENFLPFFSEWFSPNFFFFDMRAFEATLSSMYESFIPHSSALILRRDLINKIYEIYHMRHVKLPKCPFFEFTGYP